jgi:hypothetical protein
LSCVEEEHPLLSRFSLETYKSFVESQKPPPIAADLKASRDDGAAMSVDVIRCRLPKTTPGRSQHLVPRTAQFPQSLASWATTTGLTFGLWMEGGSP